MSRGIRWPDTGAVVTIPWPGSVDALAHAIDRAVETPLDTLEPARVPAATLAAWARPPGLPPPNAVPTDEGDRRIFWALALVLLAVEWWMRGRRHAADVAPVTPEVRVA